MKLRRLLLLVLISIQLSAVADSLRVAVASNFVVTLQQLAHGFKQKTGHDLVISTGSTGQLYAKITQGAPYDLYMAADRERPQLLIDSGTATDLKVYALGQLVLITNINEGGQCPPELSSIDIHYFAIANPDLAPYGLAAQQYLMEKSLWKMMQDKLVMGENVSQAMHMVVSKNATAGLVAKALLSHYQPTESQCVADVGMQYHQPIEQAMVRLTGSKKVALTNEFIVYLRSGQAIKIIKNNGYMIPPETQDRDG